MQTRSRTSLVGAALTILVAGCGSSQQTIGGPCIATDKDGNPCGTQFYYPTGIAIDPIDPNLLYVSNGNADLRYAGGTLNSVDAALFECALKYLRTVCKSGWLGDPNCERTADKQAAHFDPKQSNDLAECAEYKDTLLGLSFGDFLDPQPYADGNGVPTRADCHNDSLDPGVIECDEAKFISGAVQVGNFAGSIRVQTGQALGGNAGVNRRLWLPVRGDPSLTFVYASVVPGVTPPKGGPLLCGDTPSAINLPEKDPDKLASCNGQRITVRDFHSPLYPGYACSDNDLSACVSLPPEPFGVYYDEGCLGSGATFNETTLTFDCPPGGSTSTSNGRYQHLLVTYLQSGEVALIDASVTNPVSTQSTPKDAPPVVLDLRGGFFPADTAGRRGTFSIAPKEPGNAFSWWYATSRLNPLLSTFRVAEADVLLSGPQIIVGGPQVALSAGAYSAGDDVRDIVFDPASCEEPSATSPGQRGCRAFAVNNHPPSVFTVDTRYDTSIGVTPGALRNDVTDIVDVCQGPARLAYRGGHTTQNPDEPSRLYVVCFASNQVLAIDPDLSTVVAQTLVGRGANEIAFNFGYDEVRKRDLKPAHAVGGSSHRRAYVTDFLDMNVSVIDLDPGSQTENHVIGRIGLADPPRLQ